MSVKKYVSLVLLGLISGVYAFGVSLKEATSTQMKMIMHENMHELILTGNVVLIGQDHKMTCDEMTLFAQKGALKSEKKDKQDKDKRGGPRLDSVDKIFAEGNVVIMHRDKVIRSGKATVYPKKGETILEESPEIEDPNGILRGHKIVYNYERGQAVVESAPTGERPRVLFNDIPKKPVSGGGKGS